MAKPDLLLPRGQTLMQAITEQATLDKVNHQWKELDQKKMNLWRCLNLKASRWRKKVKTRIYGKIMYIWRHIWLPCHPLIPLCTSNEPKSWYLKRDIVKIKYLDCKEKLYIDLIHVHINILLSYKTKSLPGEINYLDRDINPPKN